ncbi:MAG: TonB-dependent vitamin B12 receptor BtuB [Ginsengibacter sp.]
MSKKKLFTIVLLLICTAVSAQNFDTAKSVNLDEVIITANKISQKQSTTGKVVTVINKDLIEKSQGKTLAGVLNEQAGITINGALNNIGANQTIYMRGAASGRTLILLDGIPVYDPSNINNEFDINLISLNNVESIEICRGSQSTIYGSDAIAGVINIITTSNSISKKFNLKGSASAGNYGTFRTNAQLYGAIENFIYDFKYGHLSSKGFSSAYDSTGTKNFAPNKYNGDVISGSLLYNFSPAFNLKSYFQNSTFKTDLDAGAFTDEKDYTVNNKSIITGVSAKYRKDFINVTANYQYNKTNRFYLNDSLDVPSFVKYSTDKYLGETQFAEIFTNIQMGKRFNFVQGADYRFSSFHNEYYSLSSYGPYSTRFKDTSLSQSSLYGSLIYHDLLSKLNIELGGRLNVHSRYGSNSTYTFNPSYKFTENFRAFGSIESGFKAPSLYQLYSAYGNKTLNPETSRSYELGLQTNCKLISGRVVYFKRDIENGLDFDYNKFRYVNLYHQSVKGLEAEVQIKPIRSLTITANYTFLDPKENGQSRVTFNDTSYSYLLRRPANTFNINIGYSCEKLYLSLGGKYTGSRYDAAGYQKPDMLLKDYFIINGYTSYDVTKNVKLFADAQNIFNSKFVEIRGYNSVPFIFNAGITFKL